MPRDGSNVYSKPSGTTAAPNTTIESSKFNSVVDDLVTDANTARPEEAGGTAATNFTQAKINMGLVPGTDIQAYNAALASLAGLTGAADKLPYFTALDTFGLTDLTSFARTLLDDADAATMRTTLDVPSNAETMLVSNIGTGANNYVQLDGSGYLPALDARNLTNVSLSTVPDAIFRDLKTQNTDGGDFTSGAWRTRDLNNTLGGATGVSLSSNQLSFTKPGLLVWSCPAYAVDSHQSRLRNITDSTTAGLGSTEFCNGGSAVATNSTGAAFVEASHTYEIQHRCSLTRNTDGFGTAANFGQEVYSVVHFIRTE